MKNHRSFFWLALVFLGQTLAAQPTKDTKNLWRPGFYVGGSYGGCLFTRSEPKIAIPEVAFPASGATWSLLDMGYTLPNGLGFRFLANKVVVKPFVESFHYNLERDFPGYYIQNINMDFLFRRATQLALGLTFTQSHGKYFFRPSLMFGRSRLYYRKATAQLKEQGSNQLYSLRFLTTKSKNSSLYSPTLMAGIKFGYAIDRNFGVSASVDVTTIKHQLYYGYSTSDELTGTFESKEVSLKYWQVGAGLQVGLFLIL